MRLVGQIQSFDEARGDGAFLSDDGEEFYFHCVVITDGTRTIAVGARATAVRHVGHLGRDELSQLEAINP
ncbi:MAG: hypothetical protein HIU84_09300 [Acidobacteria bacterium]|nr:hypothetical protein [Acidobacteriota bacterium]